MNQAWLETQLRNIFPLQRITVNIKKEASITNPQTGQYLEVDVWLPDLNLCFEFQDVYHYNPSWYSQIPLDFVRHKDNVKRRQLLEQGLTLITIPCWWDGSVNRLKGTIHFHYPDLFPTSTHEIASSPPEITTHKLMLASFPECSTSELLCSNLWWVGEKWDGVRCYWNTADKEIYSRHNVEIRLHYLESNLFGQLELDGELWCGRGFFYESRNVLSSPPTLNSSFFRFVCFDEASDHTRRKPFEQRYELVLSQTPYDHPITILAPRFLCADEADLHRSLHGITSEGGEGLILREPCSRYQPGRSKSLLKLKAQYSDQEALVTETQDDGSLLLQLPNGNLFSVSKDDCELHQKPARGDIVSFTFDFAKRLHHSLSKETSPLVHRIRTDLTWEDVLSDYPTPARHFVNDSYQSFGSRAQNMPQDTISTKQQQNSRQFLDDFAASRGMDPLDPEFWYKISLADLPNGCPPLQHRHLATNLVNLYPEVQFSLSRFKSKSTLSLWRRETKSYFDMYASSKSMDSLNPLFWYRVTLRDIAQFHSVCKSFIKMSGNKLSAALMSLYPNIGLAKSMFRDYWKRKSIRKAFFDQFAASKKMDSLNPIFWYNTTERDLNRHYQGYKKVLQYYGGCLDVALMELYPNIGLVRSKFKASRPFGLISDRRSFFDQYATYKKANPLSPHFWYSVTWRDLENYNKDFRVVLSYYEGELATALINLYPRIGLEKGKFKRTIPWKYESTQKEFFDKFAAAKGGDSLNPEFWSSVSLSDLAKFQKELVHVVVVYYGGKLSTALAQIYPNIGIKYY